MTDSTAIFEATLWPHRSLSAVGFLILMTVMSAVGAGLGLYFLLQGAWPITGFFGLEFLGLYLAFRVNYRRGRQREEISLDPRRLAVSRIDHYGNRRQWSFHPGWVRVDIDEPVDHDSQLTLSSHGRRLRIASFLAPHERASLADALRAALRRLRRGVPGESADFPENRR